MPVSLRALGGLTVFWGSPNQYLKSMAASAAVIQNSFWGRVPGCALDSHPCTLPTATGGAQALL